MLGAIVTDTHACPTDYWQNTHKHTRPHASFREELVASRR